MSASISAGESGRSRSDRGAHTHTRIHLCKVVGRSNMLITQVAAPFRRGHAWRRPYFEPGAGCNHQEHCFHSDPTFDSFFFFFKLTFTPLSDAGGSESNYCVCKGPSFLGGVSVKSHCYKKNLKLISKASDTSLRCHLTQIKLVLDSSEGHGLVYSDWQHFYEPMAWREPGTRESNGSNLF